MLKKNLLNLFLLIFVAVLTYLVINSEPENKLLDRLSTINPNTINSISIQHNAHRSQLNKQQDEKTDYWQFIAPVKIDGNPFRISSLLQLLNAPIHSKYKLSEVNLDDIGLSKPSTQIKFDSHLIQFGTINPLNDLRFILYNDNVYLIEDVYSPLIRSNFTTLAALELLPRDSKLQKLVLLNQTIEKNNTGKWKSKPALASDTIVETVQKWQQHQAFAVHEYLERPALGEVSIFLEDKNEPIIFKITDTDPWLILARPELKIEYHLDLDVYNTLLSPLDPDDENSKI